MSDRATKVHVRSAPTTARWVVSGDRVSVRRGDVLILLDREKESGTEWVLHYAILQDGRVAYGLYSSDFESYFREIY